MSEEDTVYSLSLEFLYDLISETEDQVVIIKALLPDFLLDSYTNLCMLPLVNEALWINFSILKLLDEELENAELRASETDGQQEMVVSEPSITMLQRLLLTRYRVTSDINRMSHSLSLN